MTQHLSPQDTEEDRSTLRRLGMIVGGFLVFAIVMAVIIGLTID